MGSPPAAGTILAGRFRVERIIGQGGMGVVLLAQHLELEERVALKMLSAPDPSPDGVERLRREARAAAQLRSDHVARVMDFLLLDDGRALLVMEYVPGSPLSALLQQRGPLPVAEAVALLLDVCDGIAEAHALGIVHRDIKPSNLMLARRPDGSTLVKILDFGVARRISPGHLTLTRGDDLLGSPMYMSPEQVSAPHDVDARADLWSMGVVLYELLTGKLPFRAFNTASLLAAILKESPIPPRFELPSLPEPLEALILDCLQKDPERRPRTVAELTERLVPFAPPERAGDAAKVARILSGREGLYAPTESVDPPEATRDREASQLTASRTAATRHPSSSPPPRRLAVAGALLAALGGLGWATVRSLTPHDPRASTVAPSASPPAPPVPSSTGGSSAPSTADSSPLPGASPPSLPPSNAPSEPATAAPTSTAPSAPRSKPAQSASSKPPPAIPPAIPPAPRDSTDFGGR